MKKIQYILLASLAIGAGASAASLPEEAAAMAEQFLSQKMGGKTADGGCHVDIRQNCEKDQIAEKGRVLCL